VRKAQGNSAEADAGIVARPRQTRDATPASRKSQTISDSVHAVISPLTTKMIHATVSLSVLRVSFHALRAMIAITAAPMP
jgi:hypothetical protein